MKNENREESENNFSFVRNNYNYNNYINFDFSYLLRCRFNWKCIL